MKFMFYITLWISKLILKIVKLRNPDGGSSIAGEIACKLCKNFVSKFKNIDSDKVIIVTGTNGKSTTINMVAHSFKVGEREIATNIEGANMLGGVATTLIKNSTMSGKFTKEVLLLEIDERCLAEVRRQLPAKHLCITNIQKDQVQRNGEPDYIYQKIKKAIDKDVIIYANNEEPRVKSFEDLVEKVIYYGMERNSKSFEKNGFYDVTLPCPKCNSKIKFNYYNVDNIGSFECIHCDFKSKDDAPFFAKDINYEKKAFTCNGIKYLIPYEQPFFIYNFVLCIAICKQFGINEEVMQKAFSTFKNISGRLETIKFKTKEIKYIRIKQENPETLQTAIDYVSQDKTKKICMIGLEQLVDFHPYYTNSFYAFDCDYKELIASNVERYICFSEAIAADTANCLIYAGIEKEKISILSTDSDSEILKELDKYDIDNVYLITWIKKYKELIHSVEGKV